MPRTSVSQWQQLVEQQQTSGLSAARFCRDKHIAYANFCYWRRRLQAESTDSQKTSTTNAAFIDLETLLPDNTRPWHIVLRLGNGIELCLNQA